VALGNRILAVLLDDARVLIFALSKDSRTARQLSVLNGLGHEADLRIDAEDSIWALVRHRARIVRFDSAGNLLGEYARLGETELRRPQGLVLLPGGELAVFNDQSRVLRGKPSQ
jgi:sugar lactone lactonase YvrE